MLSVGVIPANSTLLLLLQRANQNILRVFRGIYGQSYNAKRTVQYPNGVPCGRESANREAQQVLDIDEYRTDPFQSGMLHLSPISLARTVLLITCCRLALEFITKMLQRENIVDPGDVHDHGKYDWCLFHFSRRLEEAVLCYMSSSSYPMNLSNTT